MTQYRLMASNSTPRERVDLPIYPLDDGLSEVRFWRNDSLIDV